MNPMNAYKQECSNSLDSDSKSSSLNSRTDKDNVSYLSLSPESPPSNLLSPPFPAHQGHQLRVPARWGVPGREDRRDLHLSVQRAEEGHLHNHQLQTAVPLHLGPRHSHAGRCAPGRGESP